MIQFNLLPDVKIEFIKTRYRKRLIMVISAIASAACFGIFVLLFLFVRVNQPQHIKDLDKDIKTNLTKIQSTPDLDKILTIQNQLNSLPGLHDKKVVSSRLVDYLTQVTPNQATISDVDVDFAANTMSIKGNADGLATVNKYVDSLKFTDYKLNSEGGASGKAFKDVVLQGFAVSSPGLANGASYTINLSYDPLIFSQVKEAANPAQAVSLSVPKITSTRSATEKPASLFAPQPEAPATEQGGR
jgi:hypothetical protein